ncbi:hypothetical protein AT51_00864 [Streptococcus equi subsp. zooepidemicus Sz57]|nr:hypothetical protein AT51_00864 [Streptococcus equi subsp. zooepidemicus Sz57]HEL1286062.1 hypothetical protein [Streptococcus equi subsp. zooepidemicus]
MLIFNENEVRKLNLIDFYRYLIFTTQNQVLRKLVKLASSLNVKNQLQYSRTILHGLPWGIFFFERTGDAIDVVVAALVAYEYGCKGDAVSVPQNVNISHYINVSKHSRVYLMGVFSVLSTKMAL